MPIAEHASRTAATVGTTEYSIVNGSTTLATDPTDAIIQVYVDPANMAVGDEYVLRVYETVRSGGTKRVVEEWTLMGAQSEALVTPSMLVMHGWDVTLQKVAGTDRAFDLSIRKVS